MDRTVPAHLTQGLRAEKQACRFLKKRGLKLLGRNYRCPFGEIDLIMRHDDMLVFVEVRYRKTDHYGTPVDSIDSRKQKKLRATAEHYLQHTSEAQNRPCRFDFITFTGHVDDKNLSWIQNTLF